MNDITTPADDNPQPVDTPVENREPDEDGMPEDPGELSKAIRASLTEYRSQLPVWVTAGPASLSQINSRIERVNHDRANAIAALLERALPFVDYHG